MQKRVLGGASDNVGSIHDFGEKMRAARSQAAMTQAHLQTRLRDEFRIELDTSGITRMEAGQREPRLSEAIAIAAVLGIEMSDLLSPTCDLNRQLGDIADLLSRTRESLVALLLAADQITEYVKTNPDSLGGEKLENLISQVIDCYRAEIHSRLKQEPKAPGRAEKLKRQLLAAVTAELPSRSARVTSRGVNEKAR